MFRQLRISQFFDRIIDNLGLNSKKILDWYSILLVAIAFLSGLLIAIRSGINQISINELLSKNPGISVELIIILTDLIIGYYCLMNKEAVLKNRKTFKSFMLIQCISQILVGNVFAFCMSFLGVHLSNKLSDKNKFNQKVLMISIFSIVSALLCFVLLLVIEFK